MFEPEDLQTANLTSTKKADELHAMLALAKDVSLEEISAEENTTSDMDDTFNPKPSDNADETIRNIRMIYYTEDEDFVIRSKVKELNAQLDGRDRIIAQLRTKIRTLEENAEMCSCKKKRARDKSQEKSYQGKSKSRRMSRERSYQKPNKSLTRERSYQKTNKLLSKILEEKTSIRPVKNKWTPKNKVKSNLIKFKMDAHCSRLPNICSTVKAIYSTYPDNIWDSLQKDSPCSQTFQGTTRGR